MHCFSLFPFFILPLLLYSFLLLFPFYLKQKKPQKYKGVWLFIGEILRTRFNALMGLNFLIGHHLNIVIGLISGSPTIGYACMVAYLVIITPAVFWYPFFIRESKPESFRGLIKVIADWMLENY